MTTSPRRVALPDLPVQCGLDDTARVVLRVADRGLAEILLLRSGVTTLVDQTR